MKKICIVLAVFILSGTFALTSCRKDGTGTFTTNIPETTKAPVITMPGTTRPSESATENESTSSDGTTDTVRDDISEAVSDIGENVSGKIDEASSKMDNASERMAENR